MNSSEINTKKINIRKVFSIFFALSIILNSYSSGIGSISLTMLGFAFFSILVFLYIGNDSKLSVALVLPILLFVYFFVNTIIQSCTISNEDFNAHNSITYLIRLAIWVISVSFCVKHFLDFKIMRKWFRIIALLSCCYLLFQIVSMYILHVITPSHPTFGILKLNYDVYDNNQYGVGGYRPSAFFTEPSFFAAFILLEIILTLFIDKNEKNIIYKIKYSSFYTFCIFLSTSSGGIYMSIIVWCLFFVFSAKGKMKVVSYFLLTIIIIAGFSIFNDFDWNSIQTTNVFGSSMKYAMLKVQTLGTSGRVGKSFDYINVLHGYRFIFGVGVGNEITYVLKDSSMNSLYMNSMTQILFYGGVFGTILFVLMNMYLFFKSKSSAIKVLIIVYLFYGYFSGIYFSLVGIIYFVIIEYLFNYGNKIEESNVQKENNS